VQMPQESLYAQLHFGNAPVRALRGDGWKLIDVPRAELYRISDAPHEKRNLVEERAPVAAAMRASLRRLDRDQDSVPEMPQVDETAAERLAALGYVGGEPASGRSASGVDLKDRIAEVQRYTRDMREGLRLYREGQFAAAARLLRRVSETSPPSFNVQYYLGRSLLDSRRHAEAIPYLRKAAEMAPTRRTLSGLAAAPIYAWLVEAYAGAGQMSTALQTLDTARAVAPANAELLRAKGSLLLRQGDLGGARTALEKARSVSAREPRLHVELSNVYRNLGELAPAEAAAREAEAGRSFREALRLSPDHPDALFYLGAVELRAGHAAAAVSILEKLVAATPEYPRGRETLAMAKGLAATPPPAR
jgi:tetratricopeptide (TPR) repeat protein